MFIRFNDDNIWEIIGNDKSITCYKRRFGKFTNMVNIDKEVNDEEMIPEGSNNNNFNYSNWKAFLNNDKLKRTGMDPIQEQYALPLIYYCRFILGFNSDDMMERISPTRYIFER